MSLRKYLLSTAVGAAALIGASAQAATTLTLDNPAPSGQQYQQTQNSPCIFDNSSCNQPTGFNATLFPAGGTNVTYNETATFTVGQIRAIVGNTFIVGIDVNTTTQPNATEKLDFFDVTIGGVQQYVFDPATPGEGLITANNGNGYADALLKTISIASYADSVLVTFHVIQNNSTDGREQYFLVSTTTPPPTVPEPASLALFGMGLLGLGMAGRRRRSRA